jgi:hypothetical protein
MSLIIQNNNILKTNFWHAIFQKINNDLNENINIYLNLKNSNGLKFINKTTETKTIFLAGSKNDNNILNSYQFITINSLNPNLGEINKNIEYNEKRFNYVLSRIYPYNNNYKYNKNGYILVLLNNVTGWFSDYYSNNIEIDENKNEYIIFSKNINDKYDNKKYNLFKNSLYFLIKNIRKYSNRKIIIRLHPKNRDINIFSNEFTINDQNNIEQLINNCYCCFIQNTRLLFYLVHKGIPLFSLNYYIFNYFPEIYVDIKNLENLNKEILPNRLIFLKKYYKYIFFKDELNKYDNFKNMLKYYKIL